MIGLQKSVSQFLVLTCGLPKGLLFNNFDIHKAANKYPLYLKEEPKRIIERLGNMSKLLMSENSNMTRTQALQKAEFHKV